MTSSVDSSKRMSPLVIGAIGVVFGGELASPVPVRNCVTSAGLSCPKVRASIGQNSGAAPPPTVTRPNETLSAAAPNFTRARYEFRFALPSTSESAIKSPVEESEKELPTPGVGLNCDS